MKNLFSLLLVVLLFLFCLTSCSGSSTSPTAPVPTEQVVNYTDNLGIGYSILSDGSLSVVKYSGNADLIIPEQYNGKVITTIGRNAFRMSEVKKITLPNSISIIDEYAFAFATSLQEVNLPEGITSIGNNAFTGCTKLDFVDLPETLKNIGFYAFDGAGISSIVFPDGLQNISEYAFAECVNLTDVIFNGNDCNISNNAFNKSENVIIYGEKSSTAINYAKTNGLEYEVLVAD